MTLSLSLSTYISSRMTEMKYCFGCQRKREIEHFEEGFKSCNVCREKKKGIQTENILLRTVRF